MKKTTLTLLLCAALVLSACNTTPHDDSVTESTVNINDTMNNPDAITDSEISELIEAYLAFEFLTERASDSMSVDYDQSYTDGLYYYHKVTDERYDTWEEWAAYVGSIFTGDYLTRILNTKEVFINVDGYTYWQSGAMGWYIEDDYTYETSDISTDKMTLRIIRTESVPEEEENIITTNFELCMTDGGWRICGLAAPKDTFEANIIENIIYHSDRGGKAQALEDFYSDDTYTYSFPTIRSDVVIVYYNDGTEQTVKDALAEGKIKISDLDRFGIKYNKNPIDYSHWYTFEYEGVKYDLSEIFTGIMGVEEGPHIGKYVIAVGHINPDNSGYAVINTETKKIEHHFGGSAPTYHSDDINTIVYAFWNNVCALDGTVLATLELADGEYIRELTYTDDFQKIEVTISNENDDRTEAVLLPDDSVHLKDNGTSLLVSLLTTEPENNKWLMFGDCTQFSLSPDKNLIFTIYNGRYLSIGNAIMQGNEVYVPYTVLEAVGMTQTIAGGFGSNQFTFGDAVVRIPWASDYYVIENGDIYIEEKRVQLYHNDILYIPAARILEPLGFTVEYVENMPGHNSYAALIISDSNRTPSITINQAKELLNNAVYQLYATEIKKTESDLAEGRTIYSDEAFERLKADSSSVSMEYYDTYSDYYVFKLSDYPVYTYINMHNGEVYYDDRWSLPDLHISSGVMRVSDLYY